MNKQSVMLPGSQGMWGSYVSKYQPDSNKVLDNMFTVNSKNFVTDQTGMIQKRQGGIQWNRTSFPEAAKDTYEAVFESGARHFLRVGGGVLSASTGTGLFDVITSGYSTLGNFEWATYQNRVYGDNGINAPQVYDIATSYGGVTYTFTTAKTRVMGAQAPTSGPTAAAPSAGGAIPIGSHRYKVTYMYYDSEESNGSVASSIQTTTSGNQTIALSTLPIGGYGVTARNIYRDNNDGVYLLLDTVPNNTATTYTDVLLIGATPTPMPLFNDPPPTFSKIALWLDSIFIAPTGETNVIRFSNAGAPDVFDPDNFVTCQSDDVVTALYVYNGKLYVFGLHSFGSIEGNTPDTFYYHNISNLIGCVDNRSIQVRSIVSVPTLWWLSDKGLYFSNGNTVEYGSDLIQDLVNLNLAQVNYSTGRNTQTSQTDFAGDTYTPGIDITTNPGSIMTVNPRQEYSVTADWLGGSSSTNIKTSDGNFLEVPTQFTPSLSSGALSGSAQISGTNLTIPANVSIGDSRTSTLRANFINGNILRYSDVAYALIPAQSGTLTSVSPAADIDTLGTNPPYTVRVYADAAGIPGTMLFESSTLHATTLVASHVYATLAAPITCSVPVVGGTKYWIGIHRIFVFSGDSVFGVAQHSFLTSDTVKLYQDGSGFPVGWTDPSFAPDTYDSQTLAYVQTTPSAGVWTSPIYDSGSAAAISASITESGTYPTNCSGIVTVYASNDPLMAGAVNQSFFNPNGTYALSLTGYRYWQIVVNLATTDNLLVPTLGTPVLKFNIAAEWISQPIDTTLDNTVWGSLTSTGNVPLGTSVILTIATSASQFSGYSSYGPIGSALVQQWAKVKVALATDAGNTTSPSVASVTLTWSVTSTITSSIIDTGTTPSGFNVFQWEQFNPGVGTVLFYLRTAATTGGIPSATWVLVTNGDFPAVAALRYAQWKAVITSTSDNIPEITSITVSWFVSSGASGVRCASLFYNKTYYLSVATIGATENNTLIQLDQFGNWRIQKDTSVGTLLSYFNTLYFTDGINGNIYNGFIADTDNGTAITMDVRTKAWNAENDLFLKIPRAFKVTGLNTGTTLHAYYSNNRGGTWYEMLNEQGATGFVTNSSGTEFVVLFVPDATTLTSGRTLMYRLVSSDSLPCSIINYVPSFYSRKGRYLSNG